MPQVPAPQGSLPNRTTCGSPVLLKVSSSRGGTTASRGNTATGCCQQPQYRLQLNTMHLSSANLAHQLAVAQQFVVDTVALSAPRPPSTPAQPIMGTSTEAHVGSHNNSSSSSVVPIDTDAATILPKPEQISPASASSGLDGAPPRLSFGDIAIVEVTFNHNLLTDDCFSVLIPFLASNTHIRSFEILGNRLTDGVAPYLRQLILECPHVKRMKLADNFLSEAAAVEIGEAILFASLPPSSATSRGSGQKEPPLPPLCLPSRTSRRFLQLNVGGNVVGPRGIKTLCEAALASGLQILGLRGVRLDPLGWAACGALCAAYAHPAAAEPMRNDSTHTWLKHRRSSGASGIVAAGEENTAGMAIGDGEDDVVFSDDGEDGDDDDGGDGRASPSNPCAGEAHLTSHCVRELQVKMNPMNQACMESFVQSALCAASEQVKIVTKAATTAAAANDNLAQPPRPSAGPTTFVTFSTITALNLACCTIDAALCRRLVDLLLLTKYLEELDLSGNHLSDLGTRHLCEWLNSPSADCLKFFSLGNNHLTAASLHLLSDTFRQHANRELRLLDLGSNVFGVAATPHLIQLLMYTPSLEKLHLRGCLFGGPHLGALVRQITSLTHLSDLDFTANLSGEEGYQWQWLISSSTSIRRLLLTDNSMPAAATTAIANAIGKSTTSRLVVLQIGGKSKVEPYGNSVTTAAHSVVLRGIHRNRQGGAHPPLSPSILCGSGNSSGHLGRSSSPPPPPPPQQHHHQSPLSSTFPLRGSAASPVNHPHAMMNLVSFTPSEGWGASFLGGDRSEVPVTAAAAGANTSGLLGVTLQSSSLTNDKDIYRPSSGTSTLLDATAYKSSSSMGTTRRGSSSASRVASFSRSLNSTVVASPVDDVSTMTTVPSRILRHPDLGDAPDLWVPSIPSGTNESARRASIAAVPGDNLSHTFVPFASFPQFLPHQRPQMPTPVLVPPPAPGAPASAYPHYVSMTMDAPTGGPPRSVMSSVPSAAVPFPAMMYHPGTPQQPMLVSPPPPSGAGFYVYRIPDRFE